MYTPGIGWHFPSRGHPWPMQCSVISEHLLVVGLLQCVSLGNSYEYLHKGVVEVLPSCTPCGVCGVTAAPPSAPPCPGAAPGSGYYRRIRGKGITPDGLDYSSP
ncbi:hypothetical protein GDO81_021087 [Engystomops pustulosus]|uniref:Uncharacterized protein n=1 Tax=Engystomops pustulosus TaxID=76066 RepID=A0AAV6Z772_ENGPU|nr:hypothetical protein GDO81_021087 [Engystomops pustulosus]